MFKLIENDRDKKAALKVCKNHFESAYPKIKGHKLSSPGGSMETTIYTKGHDHIYAALNIHDRQSFYAFGLYNENRLSQNMITQINVPLGDNRKNVAGFLARDIETKSIYLIHSGKVGGGAEGVGMVNFLTWTNLKLQKVIDSDDKVRTGILIGQVGSSTLPKRIFNFVKLVGEFKAAQNDGEFRKKKFLEKKKLTERYIREFSGQKKRAKTQETVYLSFHGDVVDAIKKEISKKGKKAFNTQLVDLYTEDEVFEVKSSSDRQSIYTAIGQLLTHRLSLKKANAKMILVIPKHANLPDDLDQVLASLKIKKRVYSIVKNDVRLH